MTNTEKVISRLQIAAIILIAAGWGWIGGNFTPSDAPLWNFLLHTIPILLLLVLSLGFFHVPDAHQLARSHAGWATVGISIFAGIAIIGQIVGIILGASNPDPNAFGVKTLADWVPSVIVMLGSLVWLATLIPALRGNAEARTASNN